MFSDGSRPSSNDDDSKFHSATFDPFDHGSYYFGPIGREAATSILLKEHDDGVFLIRDSEGVPGSFVLCVRESGRDSLVSHYLIEVSDDPNASPSEERKIYTIGPQTFSDIPSLLNFYKVHYLESTPLVRPAPRQSERVRAKFDFAAPQPETDLPFRRGETLWVLQKDDDTQNSWWTARNALGQTGQIPSCYVEPDPEPEHPISSHGMGVRERNSNNSTSDRSSGGSGSSADSANANDRNSGNHSAQAQAQRQLPAYARVKQARIPNAYDKSALRLEVGDRILVTKMNPSGTWEGELNGRRGHFPFTYVEFESDG